MLPIFAVDFETTYAKGVRDISTLGVLPYLLHPETGIYLVAIHGPGIDYSGPVETAPWAEIAGAHWVSHNAAFDAACFMVAVQRGQIPDGLQPEQWDCTANLAAFLGANRSLKKAAASLLGVEVDKTVRDEMNGKTWETMTPEFRAASTEYAKNDARLCHAIWTQFAHHWPEPELALSRHTMEMCLRGIAVDLELVTKQIAILEQALWRCALDIPWANTTDAKGKEIAITSIKALREACVAAGIPPPMTTADKSEIFEAWIAEHGEAAPFVRAVKNYRSLNRSLEILKKFRDQTAVNPDGRLRFSLKYFGAHTGRWSGDSGLNFQNFTKDKLYFDSEYRRIHPKTKEQKAAAPHSVDLRGCLVPGPGKKFIVADLAQIEARVALWFAHGFEQLALLATGMDIYEAHARQTMGYTNPRPLKEYCEDPTTPAEDRNLRQFAKCRVLGLGFGLGPVKFVQIVAQWVGLKITLAQAKQIVADFRAKNPGIVAIWKLLDRAMRTHATKKDKTPFTVELPSWRSLTYFNVNGSSDLKAQDEMGGAFLYYYGGKLFENMVQATARDILGENILMLEAAGYPVVLHVHDEVICEVDLDVPLAAVRHYMSRTPDWMEGLPVSSDVKETMRYFK